MRRIIVTEFITLDGDETNHPHGGCRLNTGTLKVADIRWMNLPPQMLFCWVELPMMALPGIGLSKPETYLAIVCIIIRNMWYQPPFKKPTKIIAIFFGMLQLRLQR